ncbi:MAG: septum formation protein Maf [Alphaproteobacteria bacterium]|nr:septum formation protein Maf [Alphaproteobacteria bacterium]
MKLPRLAGLSSATPVVLASASRARRTMLENAGLAVAIDAAHVDEDEVKRAMRADGAPVDAVAEMLAELKAKRVSNRHPGALVIGADQMLECNGVAFDKPRDAAEAATRLRSLSGRTHRLVSAVVVARDGARLWHDVDAARLAMRPLSEPFIAEYLAALGEDALASVGSYQLEGLGAQLFTRVEGDFFTILGMPLLPLLGFLRAHGIVPT